MINKFEIITGNNARLHLLRIQLRLFLDLIKKSGSPFVAYKRWKGIQAVKQQFTIENRFLKFTRFNGRIHFNCNIPGWPLNGFEDKLLEFIEPKNEWSALAIVQIGFTKKCPLNCEHCYEGKILNQPEKLSLEEHKSILAKLQKHHIPMIQFGGGEPLNRFDDLISVLRSATDKSDFWIYSSGYGLTFEKAKQLKEAGLIGISISLDHYQKAKHNAFRRNEKSYDYAIAGIANAQKAGLLTALTVCVTREFCSEYHLHQYLEFAYVMKVPFVQLMEPRATGNYEGQDVLLDAEHFQILEDFYISRNSSRHFRHLPIVQYTGYQQRKKGCAGAGSRYIYIDTDGYVHSCPFCRNQKSHFLYGNTQSDLSLLRTEGCDYLPKPQKLNHV